MTTGNPFVKMSLLCAVAAVCAVDLAQAAADLPPEASPEYVGRKIIEQFLSTEPEDFCPKGYTGERLRRGYVFYAVGSLWVNAMEIARSLGDDALKKRLVDKFLPFYGEKSNCLAPPYHVDTTVFGAVPYEVYLLTGDKKALEMGASYADRQWEELSDEDVARMAKVSKGMAGHLLPREKRSDLLARGYTPQTRLWIDDMYMISFLQTQAYRATWDRKYIDRTAKEMVLYLDELQLKDGPNAGLFYHAPDVPFVWGRGDGWMAGGMVLVLKYLPPDSPYRDRILEGYRKMMAALLKAQRPDGLWGQLIDDPESWSETSGSAMFTYAFIEGVKNGWLCAKTYGPAARRAWIALCGRVDALGNTSETCVGTGKKNDHQYYLDRSRIVGDPHGQAPMLWCVNALFGTRFTLSSYLAAEDAGVRDFLAPERRDGTMQPVRKDIPDEAHGRFELVNRKADGFRCMWDYNQVSGDKYVYKYSGGIGVYCAGHIPMAVYSKEADKTFFCYGGTDALSSTLFHLVSYFDHKTGKLARPTIVFDKHTQDAHDNPVINLDDRGYIYVFASSHGITRPSAIARSERPYDISRFKVIWEGNYSYPQPFYFPGKGFLWLQTRYTPREGVWQWRWPRTSCFMTSDPEVENWSPCKTLQLFNEGHYQRSWPFGTEKVGVVFDQHPEGKGLNWRTDVFYMETSDFGKTWQTAAGETLEIPVSSRDTPALVLPYAEKSRNVYIKGVKFDGEGRPIVLYTVSKGYRSGPEDGPREWKIAKWMGKEWREIDTGIRSDSNYDFAELYVEPAFWRIIGASETGPQPYNCGGEIAAWISRDAGETWSFEKKLTSRSERNQNYPRQPLNVHPGFYAFWADGHGRKPSVSRLYFCDRDLNVYMMPLSFEGDAADPIPYRSK